MCEILYDYDKDKKLREERNYELPDGQVLKFGEERFTVCERIFGSPHVEWKGVHELLDESIMKCDMDIRADLFGNVLLNGGNTMFAGFGDRLKKEMNNLYGGIEKKDVVVDGFLREWNKELLYKDIMNVLYGYVGPKLNVLAPAERKYNSWIGGSILASMSSFESSWITKKEYEETGACIVNKKCDM